MQRRKNLQKMSGRDEFNKLVFNREKEFIFSTHYDYSFEEIESAVILLRDSHLIPPPMCLVYLLEARVPQHYITMCSKAESPKYPKDVPLRLRESQRKVIEATNEFIHAGGEEWLRLHDKKAKSGSEEP
jgi:hypothetical protein